MKVRETKDSEEIKEVICNHEIYECIKDDNCPSSDKFDPPMDALYIGGYIGNTIIALMVYHRTEKGLKCHIQVLPEYRKEYARRFARMALEFGEVKNVNLYSEIPVCYPNVISFAKSFGFKETGVTRNSHIRNGVNYDVIEFRR